MWFGRLPWCEMSRRVSADQKLRAELRSDMLAVALGEALQCAYAEVDPTPEQIARWAALAGKTIVPK